MDRLDEINRNNAYKSHLIKWWNVNMESPETTENAVNGNVTMADSANIGNYDDVSSIVSSFDQDVQQVCTDIFTASKRENVFEEAVNKIQLDEANAIYERLMNEAAADELEKQNEIEMAKQAASQ